MDTYTRNKALSDPLRLVLLGNSGLTPHFYNFSKLTSAQIGIITEIQSLIEFRYVFVLLLFWVLLASTSFSALISKVIDQFGPKFYVCQVHSGG